MSYYRNEFPDFPAAGMPAIPEGWADHSYCNDVCPSFVNEELGVVLFVNYPEAEDREIPECSRFVVFRVRPDGEQLTDCTPVYEGESFEEAIEAANDPAAIARAIARNWVAFLGLGFHPDTRAPDYVDGEGKPALNERERILYADDMETLFDLPGDPYAFAIEAMEEWEKKGLPPMISSRALKGETP